MTTVAPTRGTPALSFTTPCRKSWANAKLVQSRNTGMKIRKTLLMFIVFGVNFLDAFNLTSSIELNLKFFKINKIYLIDRLY